MKKNSISKNYISLIVLVMLGIGFFAFQGSQQQKEFTTEDSVETFDPGSVPFALPSEIIELSDGDVLELEAMIVKQEMGGRIIKRLAYNGQIPGPVIKVQKDATITVNLKNSIDVDTTLHSHGLRLDNAFDGVPEITQDPIRPGETFSYTLVFPDEGVYWYHPHIREDYTQELGLYGNFIVDGADDYWNKVNQEEYLIFDDFLEDGKFDMKNVTNTLMGRFGDIFLINDKQDFSFETEVGQVSRLFLTNVANTRVFDLAFEGTKTKLVGGDVGRIQKEEFIESVIIAPAERYIVEVLYEKPGTYSITHRGKKMGEVVVKKGKKDSEAQAFDKLRTNDADYASLTSKMPELLAREPDKSINLTIEIDSEMMDGMTADEMMDGMMDKMTADEMMDGDTMDNMTADEMMEDVDHGEDGIEWEDAMPMMNAASNDKNTEWRIVDNATKDVNQDIDWSFNIGDLTKIKIFNDPNSAHPMQHPIHFHGQRFVVLTEDGVVNDNLQWKDTVLIPTGQTYEILVEMTNLGEWMVHCHIAEHLHSGMMFSFDVEK